MYLQARTPRTISRTVTCYFFFGANAAVCTPDNQQSKRSSRSSQTACRYLIGVEASSPMSAIAARCRRSAGW